MSLGRRYAMLFAVLMLAAASAALAPGENHGADPQPGSTASHAARRIRLVVGPEGNEARYRVREQLLNVELPSDAVGVTTAITGAIVIEDDGTIASDGSRIVVDLTTLESDSDRRDNYVRRRTLETESFPTVEFVPTAFRGLPSPIPTTGSVTFEVIGDLSLHGVTKPVTWSVTAQAGEGAYTGTASTAFTFNEFGMTIPRVRSVLSVVDEIRLEYDFRLIPEP